MPAVYVYVYLAEGPVPAGRLETFGEGREFSSQFAYGNRYLERADRVAIDPVQLPLIAGTQFAPEYFALPNGIRDAAPDGWGRHVMDRAAGVRPLTEYDYLVATGDSRVGALGFGLTLGGPHRIAPWAEDEVLHGEDLDMEALLASVQALESEDELPLNHRRFLIRGSSMGGARPKALTELDGRPWLAKFGRQDDRQPMCRVEYVAMTLAGRAGINVPPIRLKHVFGKDVYLIERFDRWQDEFGERRTPFISGLTLLGAHESESSRYSYRQLAEQLRRFGSAPVQDAIELWKRMVFNILCGNNDDHLRNHGFLWDGKGWRISPAYDIVSFPQQASDRLLAIGVGAEGRHATLRNALTQVASFGLGREQARGIATEMQAIVKAEWERTAIATAMSGSDIERLRGCFAACDEILPLA